MITVYHRPIKNRTRNVIQEDGTKKEIVEKSPTFHKFGVHEDGDTLVIDYKVKFLDEEVSGSLRLNKLGYKGRVLTCVLKQADPPDEGFVSYVFDPMAHITSTTLVRSIPQANDEMFLGRICFEENGDINLFLYKRMDDIDGVSNVVIKNRENSNSVLYNNSKVYREKYASKKIKATMLNRLDPYDSLAYLEIQIDALTRIVNGLIKDETNIDKKSLILLDAADNQSVLNCKTLENCLDEINSHKKNVRRLQQDYQKQKKSMCA